MNQDNNTFDPSYSLNEVMHVDDATRPDAQTPQAQPVTSAPGLQAAAPTHPLQLNGIELPQGRAPESPAPLQVDFLLGWDTEAFGPAPALPPAPAPPPADQQILHQQILQAEWELGMFQMNQNQPIQTLQETVKRVMTEKIEILNRLQEEKWSLEVSEKQRLAAFVQLGKMKIDKDQIEKVSEEESVKKGKELGNLKEEMSQKEDQIADLTATLRGRQAADEEHEKERKKWEEEKSELRKENEQLAQEKRNSEQMHDKKISEHQEEIRQKNNKIAEFSADLENHQTVDERNKEKMEKLEEEKKQLHQEQEQLMQKNEEEKRQWQEEKEELLEIKKRMERAEDRYRAVLQKLEKETARNLEKKIQEQSTVVAEMYAEELTESEERHQEELKEMKRKIDESAQLQKDQEKQHYEKEAKLLEDNANLRKQIADLELKQRVFNSTMSGVARLLNKSGDTPPASETVKGIIEKGKIAIAEQIRKETNNSGQKRAADIDAAPIQKKKANNDVNADSD